MASADNSMEVKPLINPRRSQPNAGPPDKRESLPRNGRRTRKERYPKNEGSSSGWNGDKVNVGREPREAWTGKKSGRGRDWNQLTSNEKPNNHHPQERRNKNYGRNRNNEDYRQRRDSNCYNKELFVMANCQFVVTDNASYADHLRDPDLPVDWDLVEEIRILEEEPLQCPICLQPPVAGRITRCGHVYCWPCLLHYLSLSENIWRKCPICYESVYPYQLKPVRGTPVPKFKAGLEIEMVLMKREKGITRALPLDVWERRHNNLERFEEESSGYDKLILATESQVLTEILGRERRELQFQIETEGMEEPESRFTVACLNELEEKKFKLNHRARKDSLENASTSADGCSSIAADTPTAPTEKLQQKSSEFPKSEGDKTDNNSHFFFYQAGDGQLIFLHSINARALQKEFGSLENGPSRLKGEILQMDSFCMTETLRKRYRYLSHLPLTSNFVLAELKFGSGILSKETIAAYKGETKRREEMRKRRARDDEARDRLAEKWNRALMLDPGNDLLRNVTPGGEIPDIPVVTYVASAQQEIQAMSNSPPTSDELCTSPQTEDDGTPSFASMLKTGKPKTVRPQGWPSVAGTSSDFNSTRDSTREVENEDGETVSVLTSYGDEFGAALQMALDSAPNTVPKDKKGKKKKNKGTIVFSL